MEKLAILGGDKIAKDDKMKFCWPRITNATEKAVIKQLYETISIYDNSGIHCFLILAHLQYFLCLRPLA